MLENTNIKIIMRQDDPFSIEKFAKIGGSKKTLIPTFQTDEKILGTTYTGAGSLREGQAFRIDPDLIRALGRGEAIIVTKMPEFNVDYIKLSHEKDSITETMIRLIQFEKIKAREGMRGGRRYENLLHRNDQFQVKKNEAT